MKQIEREAMSASSVGSRTSVASSQGGRARYPAKFARTEIMRASRETLYETAACIVNDKAAGSRVLDPNIEATVPRFDRREMQLGKILGRGGFCVVAEIEKVRIGDTSSRRGSSIGSSNFTSMFKRNETDGEISSHSEDPVGFQMGFRPTDRANKSHITRLGIANLAKKKSRRGGRFALKRVSPDLEQHNKMNYLKGLVDLAMEAKFLASLDHPNIIALCGVSRRGPADFIVLERLHTTLSAHFKTWMKIDRQCKGITGVFTGSRRKMAELYESRIAASYNIAQAVDYLHSRNIVFRDLKPDNIGFDMDGNLKLFDFGLAKELRNSDRKRNGLYKLTGMTGAVRYMAPEVGLGKPYNLKVDVYSWAMIMWFILALEPPFGFYTEDMIRDRVFLRGSRPAIFDSWSPQICDLLKRGWCPDISVRPNFKEIVSVLKMELIESDLTANMSQGSIATFD